MHVGRIFLFLQNMFSNLVKKENKENIKIMLS